jgi:hypothetical protein
MGQECRVRSCQGWLRGTVSMLQVCMGGCACHAWLCGGDSGCGRWIESVFWMLRLVGRQI